MKRLSIFALAAGLLAGACEPANPCDAGQTLIRNLCVPGAPDAGDSSTAGSTADAGSADGGPCDRSAAFGASCAAASACGCGLDYCMTFTGPGYCTQTDCKADPGVCPSGWTCTDLSIYSPGLPSICLRP